jgi:hypothetical protein
MHLKRHRHIYILATLLLLLGCNEAMVPIYWTCTGQHTQVVRDKLNQTKEEYGGTQKLFIEIFHDSVSQINAPAAFGVYKLCSDTRETTSFSYPDCLSLSGISLGNEGSKSTYVRHGSLNKRNGQLIFNEVRKLNELNIYSSGTYTCRYLGSQYEYEEMKPADER